MFVKLDPFQARRAQTLHAAHRQAGGKHGYPWFIGFIHEVGAFSERCARILGVSVVAMDRALLLQALRQERWDKFVEASEPNEQLGAWMKHTFGG